MYAAFRRNLGVFEKLRNHALLSLLEKKCLHSAALPQDQPQSLRNEQIANMIVNSFNADLCDTRALSQKL